MSVARGKATDFSCVTTKNMTMKGANFLEKLLDNQPVEWKKLGEIGIFQRGTSFQKKHFTDEGIPCIHYGQIYTRYNLSADKTISFLSPEFASRARKAQSGDLIIATTSENDEDVCKAIAWEGQEEVVVSNDACFYHHTMHPRYVAYFFQTEQFQKQKRSYITGTKVRRVNANDLARIEIPLPPLSVQSRIVEILDKFTAMEAELEEQLQAELELRKKQYAYYREQLLNFSYTPPSEFNIVYKKLGEVAQYSKGRIDASTLSAKNYVGVDNLLQDCQGKKLSEHVPTEGRCTAYSPKDILIGNIRPYLKKIWFADNAGGTNGDVLVIQTTDERVLPEYLYQVLSDDAFFTYDMQHAKGAKMPRGNKDKILDYKIPLPPLSEQARIVEILDKFDILTNSISEGLPLEIQLRRQQYEYYREQLLAFPHS
jgi:type I restriction-modification system specificity determinant